VSGLLLSIYSNQSNINQYTCWTSSVHGILVCATVCRLARRRRCVLKGAGLCVCLRHEIIELECSFLVLQVHLLKRRAKMKMKTLDIASLYEETLCSTQQHSTAPHRRSTQVWHALSRDYLLLATYAFIQRTDETKHVLT